ncbi:MAG: Xaa-Pro dipeptidase [Pseudomonadota bacterium]
MATQPEKARYLQHLARVRASYDAAMDVAGADTAVVFSGALRYAFRDDHAYPFQVNAHFAWWLPVTDVPDSYVIYRAGETPILVYCLPDDFWHLPPAKPDPYWADAFDVRIVSQPEDARSHMPPQSRAPIFIGEAQTKAQALGLERLNPRAALHYLDNARTAKTDYELDRMREASHIAARAHTAAAEAFAAGDNSEYAIHQAYLSAIDYIDADLPYPSIVGLNEHGAVLHYQARDRKAPEVSRSFLIDAGAQSAGYASDITRTYSAEDGLFADLIAGMDELQQAVCGQVVAGADYRELHVDTHARLAQLLTDSRVGKGSAEALIESGITRAILPHGLGHYLGLQVHDVGGHIADDKGTPTERPDSDPALRLTRPLSDNEVVTIEPGLYIIDSLLDAVRNSEHKDLLDWNAIEALRPFGGIRIEDNVRINGDTPENLTRNAFARL